MAARASSARTGGQTVNVPFPLSTNAYVPLPILISRTRAGPRAWFHLAFLRDHGGGLKRGGIGEMLPVRREVRR